MRSTESEENIDSESDSQRVIKNDRDKFDDSLRILQNSLVKIIDTSKSSVFKCHIIAKLNISEMTIEEKIFSLLKKINIQKKNKSPKKKIIENRKKAKITRDGFDIHKTDFNKDVFENLKNEPILHNDFLATQDNFNNLLDEINTYEKINNNYKDSNLAETNNSSFFQNNKDFDSLA